MSPVAKPNVKPEKEPSNGAARLKPWLPQKWDYDVDVVVVGYGGAGVTAAIACHEAGVKALVLEKAPVGGGNTGCSGGGMTVPADLAKATQYYKGLSWGTVDEEQVRAFAQAMLEGPSKLAEWGAKWDYTSDAPKHAGELSDLPDGAAPGAPGTAYYPDLPGSTGGVRRIRLTRTARQLEEGHLWTYGIHLFEFFDNMAKKRGVKVMYETPAKELIQDPITKEILGVRAEGSAGELCIKARRGVVLACGGFQNNKEMLINYLPNMTELPFVAFGTPYNTGDGILMASEVGAKLWHMNGVELGQFAPRAISEKLGVGVRLRRQMPEGSQAIYVNKYGRRFVNESIVLSHRKDHQANVLKFDDDHAEYPNIPFFMVFDENFRKRGAIVGRRYGWWCNQKLYEWSEDNSAEIEQGWILKANSIEELGRKIGVDTQGLEETIANYNNCCREGEDSKFGRPKAWLAPLETPPFYGMELCQPIINTQGGPKHNMRGQVLDKNDRPIPRLYAAGELGSFFAPLYQGGSNVPEALFFGRIAGLEAAALKPWN